MSAASPIWPISAASPQASSWRFFCAGRARQAAGLDLPTPLRRRRIEPSGRTDSRCCSWAWAFLPAAGPAAECRSGRARRLAPVPRLRPLAWAAINLGVGATSAVAVQAGIAVAVTDGVLNFGVTVGVTSIAVEAAVEVPVDVGRDLLTVTVVAVAIARQVQIANDRVVDLNIGAGAARAKGVAVAALVAE